MKNNAKIWSISVPLLKENNKRFWALPVMGIIAYFLVAVFPVLTGYGEIDDMGYYVRNTLQNQNLGIMALHGLIPLVAGVMVFKYMHRLNSVTVMHSMPFGRSVLFNTNYLWGILASWVPVVTNGIILLCISKPINTDGYGYDVNVFARTEIFQWIWQSMIIVLFVYGVTVLAGMITGNSVMHFLAGGALNFLMPAIVFIVAWYGSVFTYGFASDNFASETAYNLTPMLKMPFVGIAAVEGEVGWIYCVGTLIAIAAIYVVSVCLYHKRKLEKTEEPIIFTFLEPVICYLLAFFGMSIGGLLLDQWGRIGRGYEPEYFYMGIVIGGLLTFLIARMIVKKTPRIFNKESLKQLLIYALLAAVFLVVIIFDLTGYSTRTPKVEDIKVATINDDYIMSNDSLGHNYNNYYDNSITFEEPKNIKTVTELNKAIGATKINKLNQFDGVNLRLNIHYEKQDKKMASRNFYPISYEFYSESPQLKQLYESKEFKDKKSIEGLKYEDLLQITFAGNAIVYDELRQGLFLNNLKITNESEMKEFVEIYDKDFRNSKFEDQVEMENPYGIVKVQYTVKYTYYNDTKKAVELEDRKAQFTIRKSYKNTIKWLEDKGYAKSIREDVQNIEKVEISRWDSESYDKNGFESSSSGTPIKTITDANEMQMVLEGGKPIPTGDSYYEAVIFYKAISKENPKLKTVDDWYEEAINAYGIGHVYDENDELQEVVVKASLYINLDSNLIEKLGLE